MQGSEQKGTSERHRKRKEHYLMRLARRVDLFNPKAVSHYIQNAKNELKPTKPLSKGYQKKLFFFYGEFCDVNQIPFDKPKIYYEAPVQIIPTTEQVTQIINACRPNFACIFTLLAEIAAEQEELHQVTITRINKEKGEISIIGVKQHANATYLLKESTANMLRAYLAKHNGEEYPFPPPKYMREAWVRARKRAVKILCKPELETIPLKNLRNYAGAQVWHHGYRAGYPPKDAIAVMRFMRHKSLEMTLRYIRTINLDEPMEYVTVAIQTNQPDTQERIIEHLNAGYQAAFDHEIDGYIYMRIRK